VEFLEKVAKTGLMQALAQGWFADIARSPEGGKGLDGVIIREADYLNPFIALMLQGGQRNG
jgi:beta-lysine 5,6-aminomutase alpha subunit